MRVAVTAYSRVDGVWCHTYAIAATRHTHSHRVEVVAIAAHGSKNKTPRQYGNSPIFARGMPIFSTNLSAMAEFGTATTSQPP